MARVLSRPGKPDLAELFDPVSVAVVGASDDGRKWGNWLARAALAGPRPVHLVNAGRPTVLGRRAYRSLREVPAPVGLVAICLPAPAFPAAVDDALAVGAPAIVGISAGLGETGGAARSLERELADRVRAAGSALLGPNCLGVFDAGTGLCLTSNPLPRGRVAFLSQSGNLSLDVGGLLAAHGLGFSRFASVGNQADVDVPRLIEACGRHEGTDAIAVYCEEFTDGRRFVQAARNAGKPVVLLTVGSSAAAVRMAASHTGSMVSDSAVVDAACAAAGVHRVRSPGALADLLALLAAPAALQGRRLAVLTDGGGHAAVAADLAGQAGLSVPTFSAALRDRVAARLPAHASAGNPVDVAGGGEQDLRCFSRVAGDVLASGEADALLVSGYFGGYGEYGPALAALEIEVAAELAAVAVRTGRPMAVHTMFPDGEPAAALRAGGVAVFRAVESVTAGWGLLAAARAVVPAGEPVAGTADGPRVAAAVTDTGYWSCRQLVAGTGLRLPRAVLVTEAAGLDAAAELRFPLVLKACGVVHKSDVGGVRLGIRDVEGLRQAYAEIVARLAPPACTVEEMADRTEGVELIIGVRRDVHFGPVLLVGLGGVHAEVFADIQLALAPVTVGTATEMLLRLRGAPLLTGTRGRAPVDLAAAAAALVGLGRLAQEHPELTEIEVNPVLVTAAGVLALDARAVR